MSLLPPRQSTPMPAWAMALGAHAMLVLALAWGVQWKKETDHTVAIQAELWSRVPEQAAPSPMPELKPAPAIEKPPEPTPVATPKEPEIVVKREAKKKPPPPKPAPEPEKKPEKKVEKPAEPKPKPSKTTEQQLKALRQDNLRRLSEMAQDAAPAGTGTAAQTRGGGPSATYGARIRAAIKPNIVFTDDIAGNPATEIEVRAQRNGAIMSRKIVKSSGNPRWDEAVIKAIDKTQTLPKDTDGSVPGVLLLTFRPKEE